MNSEMELKVQAYLDNELTPGEARRLAQLLSSEPEARDLYHELREMKAAIRENEPEMRLPESRDFYWSKIQREISRVEQAPARRAPAPWWTRLVAPMAGAVALFAVLLSISGTRPAQGPVALSGRPMESASASGGGTIQNVGPMHEGEIVVPEMSAITFRSEAEGVTVVWVSSARAEAVPASWLDWFE